MSSRGRGSQVEPNEFYSTPSWCVHRLLDAIGVRLGLIAYSSPPYLIEPAIGSGAIVRAVDSWLKLRAPDKTPRPVWFGFDVRSESLLVNSSSVHVEIDSFMDAVEAPRFESMRKPPCNASITNPPFSLALDMAKAAMRVCPIVIQLSRIGWLGSNDRADWLRRNTPSVYLLPDRPSFVGRGRTDSDYYAWMVWGLDNAPRFEILESTPLAERKAEYDVTSEIQRNDPATTNP